MSNSAQLAKTITRKASKQTYYTIKFMVDEILKDDCYRAYGYFRWVDDMVDISYQTSPKRVEFISRQILLAENAYLANIADDLSAEEELLVEMIINDTCSSGLLQSYIFNFLAIIEFDANRNGRMISDEELTWYANTLGKAVTDGIQYFICNGHTYPDSENRYKAAAAAHMTHMLRDTIEDLPDGYYNFPNLAIHENDNSDEIYNRLPSPEWVKNRVDLARTYFKNGKKYLYSIKALRCKIVGFWYCMRFERILNMIESDGYQLRGTYPSQSGWNVWAKLLWRALIITFDHYFRNRVNSNHEHSFGSATHFNSQRIFE